MKHLKKFNESINSIDSELKPILSKMELSENIECEIDGERVLMNEYRLLLKPGSKEEEILFKYIY